MIEIKILTLDSGGICGFKIEGHAEYEEYGKDIVCAAVSSAAYMTVNTITDILNVGADIKINENGFMYLEVPLKDVSICKDILKGFKSHLLLLEENYPNNIRISYEEVKRNAND